MIDPQFQYFGLYIEFEIQITYIKIIEYSPLVCFLILAVTDGDSPHQSCVTRPSRKSH